MLHLKLFKIFKNIKTNFFIGFAKIFFFFGFAFVEVLKGLTTRWNL